MSGPSQRYIQHMQRFGIGDGELIELLETARWALHTHRSDAGEHLDLNDDYLEVLADKVDRYMHEPFEEEK